MFDVGRSNELKLQASKGTWAALVMTIWAVLCLSACGDVRGMEETDHLVPPEPSVWIRIAQAAIPRVIIETEGEYQFKLPSGGDGVRRVTVGTDHLAAIRRFWHDDPYRSPRSSWPVLQTTVEWDAASDTYTLKRVELGFFRRWVWLVHELPDAVDRYGSIGIQIKLEW